MEILTSRELVEQFKLGTRWKGDPWFCLLGSLGGGGHLFTQSIPEKYTTVEV